MIRQSDYCVAICITISVVMVTISNSWQLFSCKHVSGKTTRPILLKLSTVMHILLLWWQFQIIGTFILVNKCHGKLLYHIFPQCRNDNLNFEQTAVLECTVLFFTEKSL